MHFRKIWKVLGLTEIDEVKEETNGKENSGEPNDQDQF